MIYKVKIAIGGIIGLAILVALFFIPTSEFGIDSHNSESPPPIVVMSSYPDDFEITPISCTEKSDSIEFEFSVTNNLDKDHRLEIILAQYDREDQPLAMQAILVEVIAGETVSEKYAMSSDSRMYSCGIELKHSEELP